MAGEIRRPKDGQVRLRTKLGIFVGVGVGWQRRRITCQSLRELDNQGTFFSFCGGCHDGYRVKSYCARWRTLTPHNGNDRIA